LSVGGIGLLKSLQQEYREERNRLPQGGIRKEKRGGLEISYVGRHTTLYLGKKCARNTVKKEILMQGGLLGKERATAHFQRFADVKGERNYRKGD